MKYCKNEMELQGWSVEDLVCAVQYIKKFKKKCKSPQGILWYVSDAREWAARVSSVEHADGLHSKVSKALDVETDDGWIRRLSLAQGKALELVYVNWLSERGTAQST